MPNEIGPKNPLPPPRPTEKEITMEDLTEIDKRYRSGQGEEAPFDGDDHQFLPPGEGKEGSS